MHSCHAMGCRLNVPPRMFACARHWRMVPKWLQGLLWGVYREGQEIDKKPSLEYVLVQTMCRLAIAEHECNMIFTTMVTGQLGVMLRGLLAEDAPDRAKSDTELVELFRNELKLKAGV